MRKILGVLLAMWAASANAQTEIQFAVPHTFHQCFFDYTTGVDIEPTITFEDGDIKFAVDGTEDATAGNDFTINDNGDCFDISLSATQATGANLLVIFNDDDDVWLPFAREFVTFGSLGAFDKTRGFASGVAQGGTATTIQLASATSFADDILNGSVICITQATGGGQCRLITDWVSSTDTATVATWTTNPDSTSQYIVKQVSQASITELTDAMAAADFVQVADLQSELTPIATSEDVDAVFTVANAIEALVDDGALNCEVNTANFAGSSTTVACILTDLDDGAVTAASGDLEGKALTILSGAEIYESRFINDTSWDAANSELQLTLSRALPGTLADAVTARIH